MEVKRQGADTLMTVETLAIGSCRDVGIIVVFAGIMAGVAAREVPALEPPDRGWNQRSYTLRRRQRNGAAEVEGVDLDVAADYETARVGKSTLRAEILWGSL